MKHVLWVLALLAMACAQATEPRRSGYADMAPALQAMQDSDAQNPATLNLLDGAARFVQVPSSGKSCAACHADGSLRGAATRYPALDGASGQLVTLAQRIRLCQSRHQARAPAALESAELLALEAHVARQSKGLPLQPVTAPSEQAALQRGQALFVQRMGQLDLSCAQCHNSHAGQRLAGSRIPQGHPTGYPLYRLEWQALGSLERRLRNCMNGVRAQAFPLGAPELAELQLYLRHRAAGLPMDAPAVRP